jgi:hypothetical protein
LRLLMFALRTESLPVGLRNSEGVTVGPLGCQLEKSFPGDELAVGV